MSFAPPRVLPVSADVREKAGAAAGDEVVVTLRPDAAPRTVTVPPDFAQAPAQDLDPGARGRRSAI